MQTIKIKICLYFMFEQSTLGLVQPCLGSCKYYIRYITSPLNPFPSPPYLMQCRASRHYSPLPSIRADLKKTDKKHPKFFLKRTTHKTPAAVGFIGIFQVCLSIRPLKNGSIVWRLPRNFANFRSIIFMKLEKLSRIKFLLETFIYPGSVAILCL